MSTERLFVVNLRRGPTDRLPAGSYKTCTVVGSDFDDVWGVVRADCVDPTTWSVEIKVLGPAPEVP